MLFKEEYNYRVISKFAYDSKYLEVKTFNDIYRKYKIVKYKKNGIFVLPEIYLKI